MEVVDACHGQSLASPLVYIHGKWHVERLPLVRSVCASILQVFHLYIYRAIISLAICECHSLGFVLAIIDSQLQVVVFNAAEVLDVLEVRLASLAGGAIKTICRQSLRTLDVLVVLLMRISLRIAENIHLLVTASIIIVVYGIPVAWDKHWILIAILAQRLIPCQGASFCRGRCRAIQQPCHLTALYLLFGESLDHVRFFLYVFESQSSCTNYIIDVHK